MVQSHDKRFATDPELPGSRCKSPCQLKRRLYQEDNDQERKKQYKKWFEEKNKDAQFGASGARLFDAWCKNHTSECRTFCLNFLAALIAVKNPLAQSQEREIRARID